MTTRHPASAMSFSRVRGYSRPVTPWSHQIASGYGCGIFRSAIIQFTRRAPTSRSVSRSSGLGRESRHHSARDRNRKDQIEKLEWVIKSREGDKNGGGCRNTHRHAVRILAKAGWRAALRHMASRGARGLSLCSTRRLSRSAGTEAATSSGSMSSTVRRSRCCWTTPDVGRRRPAPAYEQVIHGRPWRLLTSRRADLFASQSASASRHMASALSSRS